MSYLRLAPLVGGGAVCAIGLVAWGWWGRDSRGGYSASVAAAKGGGLVLDGPSASVWASQGIVGASHQGRSSSNGLGSFTALRFGFRPFDL